MLENQSRDRTNLDYLSSSLRGWDKDNNSRPERKSVTATSTTKLREPDLDVEGPSSRGSMTHCSEYLKNAARPTPLLTSKVNTKITTWDIHTMSEVGKAVQVRAEMNYTVSLLGLFETRWTQSRQICVQLLTLCQLH